MENKFEIVEVKTRKGLFKKETHYALKNLSTGKVCEQKFDKIENEKGIPSIFEGWARVKIGDKWTFFNPNTGKLCEQKFDRVFNSRCWFQEGWAAVKIDGKWTFFNPNTEKLCEQKFDDANILKEGWAKVKIGDKWTFFNPSTGKLCEQKFYAVCDPIEGWAEVLIGGRKTFFNPNTEKLCALTFLDINTDPFNPTKMAPWAPVKIADGKWTLFNPSTGKLCKRTFSYVENCNPMPTVKTESGECYFNPDEEYIFQGIHQRIYREGDRIYFGGRLLGSLLDDLRSFPEDFEHLPTYIFRNEKTTQSYLDEIAETVKSLCSQKGSTKEAEEYAQGIYDLISKKIEKEKKNIALADEKSAKAEKEYEEKEDAEKKKAAEKAAQGIKELGKNLGGKE